MTPIPSAAPGSTGGVSRETPSGDTSGPRTVSRETRAADPRWVRPALAGLLVATGLLYLWNLDASGYANSFYSAAVQAGSESWKAFFFGSSDAGNSITVDKPPAALWPMALSVRLFGLGSWQILVPEVLMGVATVAVVYAAVRRRFTPAAGLIAGAVLALTPVAALMFRFNNPDALLALLTSVAVYCVLRALEGARTAWLLWAGVALGLAFLTKTLQAFLVLPALVAVYAVCAPTRPVRRFGQLALAAMALVVSGGWWVAAVELWPAASRPYIGGSQTNSFLELTFGYNGLGRINGNEVGSVGGGGGPGGGPGGRWGETGISRMFGDAVGGQISWLLPAALLLLAAGLAVTWRAPRTDTARAAFLVWGGSLLSTLAVFSFMAGIFHEYYTVALAPCLAALVGMGVTVLWEERARFVAAATLAMTSAGTAVWAFVLLGRTPDYLPWLRWAVLLGGLVAALGLLMACRGGRRLAWGAAGLALVAALAAPAAYTVSTLAAGHTGSLVLAGPAAARNGGPGGPGGMRGPGAGGEALGRGLPGGGLTGGTAPDGAGQQPGRGSGPGRASGQAQGPGQGQAPGPRPDGQPGQGRQGWDGASRQGPDGAGQERRGGTGGLLDGPEVSAAVEARLTEDPDSFTWVAAAIGSQNAAGYQLATQEPVMPIGGFNGSDPSPTLEQFQQYVADGKIHYFIAGGGTGGRGGGPGGEVSSAVAEWVQSTFQQVTVDGVTLYDLTREA
ncbi:glycosyltransferase family 39 protein [Streptomyces sp. CC210A]|uniref:ArnT family glycosyltransferase n=1 Tax=Streptomyces sp. CC210A TaxID=2898184 RepID=UPI001F248577|nr:glycosyltransferase family 39 protein [Streptomyces sp. CC210A]